MLTDATSCFGSPFQLSPDMEAQALTSMMHRPPFQASKIVCVAIFDLKGSLELRRDEYDREGSQSISDPLSSDQSHYSHLLVAPVGCTILVSGPVSVAALTVAAAPSVHALSPASAIFVFLAYRPGNPYRSS